ncbi:hypothetical protein [Globicatella sanguinis]
MSGLNMRLKDLFEPYSTMRGWAYEAKIIQFSTSGQLLPLTFLNPYLSPHAC